VLEKTPPILAIRSLDLSEEKIKNSILNHTQQSMDETVAKLKEKKDIVINSHYS
jgi:hypothetical protein